MLKSERTMWGTNAPTTNGRDLEQGGLSCSLLKGGSAAQRRYCAYSSGPLRWCLAIGREARSGVPDCWTDESFVCGVSSYYPDKGENSGGVHVCAALCPDECRGGDRLGYDVQATEDYCTGAPYLTDADRSLIPYCNGTFVPGMEREWRRAYEREDPASGAVVGAVVVGLLAMLAMTACFVAWIRERDGIGKDCSDDAQPPIASAVVDAIVIEDLDLVTSGNSPTKKYDQGELALAAKQDRTEVNKPSLTKQEAHPKIIVDAIEAAVETQLHVAALEDAPMALIHF